MTHPPGSDGFYRVRKNFSNMGAAATYLKLGFEHGVNVLGINEGEIHGELVYFDSELAAYMDPPHTDRGYDATLITNNEALAQVAESYPEG